MADTQDAVLLKRRARRRLIGAIALVLFVVIVLPIILDQEPRPVRHDLTVQIPSQDAAKFGAKVLQKPAPSGTVEKSPTPAAPPAVETAREAVKTEPKPADAPPKAAEKQPARSAAKESPKTNPSEAKRALALLNDESYVVPLGAFAKVDNAKSIQEKVAAAGFKTYTEKVQGKDGEQIRVRAGPFETRESAEKAREKLKSAGIYVGQVAPR